MTVREWKLCIRKEANADQKLPEIIFIPRGPVRALCGYVCMNKRILT